MITTLVVRGCCSPSTTTCCRSSSPAATSWCSSGCAPARPATSSCWWRMALPGVASRWWSRRSPCRSALALGPARAAQPRRVPRHGAGRPCALFVAFAFWTAAWTRNAEAAQLTSMPVILLAVVGQMSAAFPDVGAALGRPDSGRGDDGPGAGRLVRLRRPRRPSAPRLRRHLGGRRPAAAGAARLDASPWRWPRARCGGSRARLRIHSGSRRDATRSDRCAMAGCAAGVELGGALSSQVERVDLYTRQSLYLLLWGSVVFVLCSQRVRGPRHPVAYAVVVAAGLLLARRRDGGAARRHRAVSRAGPVPWRSIGPSGSRCAGVLVACALAQPDELRVLVVLDGLGRAWPGRSAGCATTGGPPDASSAWWRLPRAPRDAEPLLGVGGARRWRLLHLHGPGLALAARAWSPSSTGPRRTGARWRWPRSGCGSRRDVHDVLGRRLSTIAVQSELAAALAERGDDRGRGERMLEVRGRRARGAARGPRAGPRLPRRPTSARSCDGARSLLRSAGIDVRLGVDELPDGLARGGRLGGPRGGDQRAAALGGDPGRGSSGAAGELAREQRRRQPAGSRRAGTAPVSTGCANGWRRSEPGWTAARGTATSFTVAGDAARRPGRRVMSSEASRSGCCSPTTST